MWVLGDKGARFAQTEDAALPAVKCLDAGDVDAGDLELRLDDATLVAINFPTSTDGRGFSLGRRVRQLRGPETKLVARGQLLPDQARLALHCGFDEIWLEEALVRRHGEAAWRTAIQNAATNLYISNPANRLTGSSGWDQRHRTAAPVKSLTASESYDALKTMSDGTILDVRTQAEWNFVGRVTYPLCAFVEWKEFPQGTINPDFVAQVEAQGLGKDCPIFVLCRSGARSLAAAQALREAGYNDLTNISDGFEGELDAQGRRGNVNGWKASGLPWQQQ